RHLLHLKFMPVIGTEGMVQVEDKGQSLFCVIFRTNVFFFESTVGTSSLPRIMNPAHEVFVMILFSNARKVCRKSPTHYLITFAYGVAAKTTSYLKKLLPMRRITRFLRLENPLDTRLPDEGSNRFA